MGLFSFLKNAGAALVGGKSEPKVDTSAADASAAADRMREQKEVLLTGIAKNLGFEVKDLSVRLNDDAVTVFGEVESQAQREKLILALGNVNGIATVDDRLNVVKPAPEATFYEVKKGDSLSKIAKEFYGNAMKYPAIFEANKPMLSDPDKIYPGQMLRIPKED